MFKTKHRWSTVVAVLLVSALLVTAAGCGPAKQDQAKDNAAKEPKVIKVAWLGYSLNDDWFKAVMTFAQAEAKKIEKEDGVKFEFMPLDAAGKEETQLAQVDDIITKGEADIVYFEPVNEKAMANAVKKLNQELNVPIGAAGITASGGKYLYVGLDNVAATKQCGDSLVKILNQKYGEPKNWAKAGGVIIELWGPPGLKITQDRHAGFRQAIDPIVKETPGLKVVDMVTNWNPDTAFKEMNDAIQRYGDKIIAVYSHDDTSATEGAWRAFELAGKGFPIGDQKHIPIVTYDGTENGMRHVREKHVDMITEQPAFGYGHLVMRYLYKWYKEGYESLPQPGTELSQEELGKYFDETTGVQFWGPVKVMKGTDWDGIWLAPKSPIIPDEVKPNEHFQWGNYIHYLKTGQFPE